MSVDITQLTAHLTPEQQESVKKAYRKQAEHPTAAFLYCFFLGIFGAHRFYLRQWRSGWLHLILPALIVIALVIGIVSQSNTVLVATIILAVFLLLIALIWEIIDLFNIDQEVYARNLKLAEQLIAATLLADPTVERAAQGRLDTMVQESEARAAHAEHREEGETALAAAAAVPPVAVAAEERESAAPGASEDAEVATAERKTDEGFGYSSDNYSAATVTQISADPNETQHASSEAPSAPPEPQSWSETETTRLNDLESQSGEKSGEETLAEAGAAGAAAAAVGLGAAGGLAFLETRTHEHDQGAYSVTDSNEQIDTIGESEATQTDEVVAAESEAEPVAPVVPVVPVVPVEEVDHDAPTVPDHPPVNFDEPVPVAAPPALDYTDMGMFADDAHPVADVATAGANPLHVVLPAAAAAGVAAVVGFAESTPAPAPAEAPIADEPGIAALGWGEEPPVAPPEYIPPTVPIVSIADAAPDDTFVPVVSEPAPEPAPIAAEEPPVVANEPAPEPESEPHGNETLEALAGVAGTAGVVGAAAAILHHEHEAAPEAPTAPETDVVAAAATEPHGDTADTQPSLLAVQEEPVAPSASEGAAAAEATPPAHNQLKRVRVKREYKVGDQVVETTYAEELIPIDADPEPVRARLQAYLHQQAEARERQDRGES